MPKGTLSLQVTDLADEEVGGAIAIELVPLTGEPGTGGARASVTFKTPDRDLIITSIECRGGPGTMYRVQVTTPHYRPYAFLQLVREDRTNPAADDVEVWVKPGDVKGIAGPSFADLHPSARRILNAAEMIEQRPEDRDLLGLAGEALYDGMGPLRQACFLNIVAKARHLPTVDANHLPSIEGMLIARQDRFFARVSSDWPDILTGNKRFKSARSTLHTAPDGYLVTEQSFKSVDPFGNLQVTILRHIETGHLAADIDIDKAAGFRHGLEVIGNAVLNNRTNPYAVRELLLATDLVGHSLNPGYEFEF